MAAGTKANSAAVMANAWQHRSDAIVSSAVFVGLCGTMGGVPLLDPLAGGVALLPSGSLSLSLSLSFSFSVFLVSALVFFARFLGSRSFFLFFLSLPLCPFFAFLVCPSLP